MKTYTLWQTATVRRYKTVEAPEDAHDDDIIDVSWDLPWKDAKVINSEGTEVERD